MRDNPCKTHGLVKARDLDELVEPAINGKTKGSVTAGTLATFTAHSYYMPLLCATV